MSVKFSRLQIAVFEKRGICVKCGKQPAIEGKRWCNECAMADAERQHQRYLRRKEARECARCGAPLPEGWTFVMCPTHHGIVYNKERARDRRQKERADAIARGRCTRCGMVAPEKGKRLCRFCNDIQKEYQNGRYQRLKESHRCVYCAKELPSEYWYVVCEECRRRKGWLHDD